MRRGISALYRGRRIRLPVAECHQAAPDTRSNVVMIPMPRGVFYPSLFQRDGELNAFAHVGVSDTRSQPVAIDCAPEP